MIRVGVIGYGYWGPNLVRNFAEVDGAEVTVVCDRRPERLVLAKTRYPYIETTSVATEVITDPRTDAIVIATPVSTHFELARQALREGKHVLVEKPLAATAEQAAQLVDEASRRDRVLLVDHTFVYTGAVRKIHELVTSGALGDIYYYDSVRVNLGLFQHDVNVIWDLAVHDFSIMDYVLPSHPRAVSATGMSHIAGQPENIAYITLFFENSLIGHIHVCVRSRTGRPEEDSGCGDDATDGGALGLLLQREPAAYGLGTLRCGCFRLTDFREPSASPSSRRPACASHADRCFWIPLPTPCCWPATPRWVTISWHITPSS